MTAQHVCMTREFLSSVLARPVASVKERHIGSLWAGYGTVSNVQITWADSNASTSCIVKRVEPPDATGTSHERKVKSYAVEVAFYKHVASEVLQTASCCIPEPLYVESQSAHSFLFVLSDLRARFPRQVDDLSLKETKAALDWLAEFHALFWETDRQSSLWEQGCYWHLDTRLEELSQISAPWHQLQHIAADVDRCLKGYGPDGKFDRSYRTLVHGDFKSENLLFAQSGVRCAAYDFQYCGEGYGVRDVVYLFCSSVLPSVVDKKEQELLSYYHEQLQLSLQRYHPNHKPYTFETMLTHYNLCMLDYVRFMAGWGFWGNASWAQAKARTLVKAQHLWMS